MPNIDFRYLHMRRESARGTAVPAPFRVPYLEMQYVHPLALLSPQIWNFSARLVGRIFLATLESGVTNVQ